MTQQLLSIHEFGPYRIDAAKRLVLRDGEVVPLTPKCFEILVASVRAVRSDSSEEPVREQPLGCDPAFDALRADPRFTDLLRRVGLPQ